VIRNFRDFDKHAVQLLDSNWTAIVPPLMRGPAESIVRMRNECAQFVQIFGIPNTGAWLRGPRICDYKVGELPVGAVIATLRDGKYHNDSFGRSRVGIYTRHADYQAFLNRSDLNGGVSMFDQWKKKRIGEITELYSVVADGLDRGSGNWKVGNQRVRKTQVKWVQG